MRNGEGANCAEMQEENKDETDILDPLLSESQFSFKVRVFYYLMPHLIGITVKVHNAGKKCKQIVYYFAGELFACKRCKRRLILEYNCLLAGIIFFVLLLVHVLSYFYDDGITKRRACT